MRTATWVWILALSIFQTSPVMAADVEFSARVDRPTISIEESLILRLTFQAESALEIEDVQFDAPQFEEVNEHRSSFIRSVYENGHISVRHSQEVVKFLRAKSAGVHSIKNIRALVQGQKYSAEDLSVRVEPGGAGTPPPKGYGSGGSGGLRSAGKPNARKFFARVELNQPAVVKGQQLFATYYLFTQVPITQMEVDKFPSFKGFLAEQLDMPFRTGRPPVERVVLDGTAYQRLTLLRYALYPLQSGKLKIDPMELKFAYQGGSKQWVDDADAFLHQFFQMVAPQVAHVASEPIEVQVENLPDVGKPASFSGAVGNFTVVATANRSTVKANDSVNLTIKVEGRGNANAVQDPKVTWPKGVDVYETKSRVKASPTGVGEKIFDILLIPRAPGQVTLPAIEFGFFDPEKKAYYTQSTDAVELQVEAGDPSAAPPAVNQPVTQAPLNPIAAESVLPEGSAVLQTEWVGRWAKRILPIFAALAVLGLVGLLGSVARKKWGGWNSDRQQKQAQKKRLESKSWRRLKSLAERAPGQGMDWNEVVEAYELLCGAVYDALDGLKPGMGARSTPRGELKFILTQELGIKSEVWDPIDQVLSFAETVRFASRAGIVTEQQARDQLKTWVVQAQTAVEKLPVV